MVRNLVAILVASCFTLNSYALNMSDLFGALKKQPITKIDALIAKKAQATRNRSLANFYPKIYGIAGYEHFNSPTSLRPVTPSESATLTNNHQGLPFSRNIKQISVQMNMPLFVYSLFSIAKKAKLMYKSAQEKSKLDLLSNQALLVSFNAHLKYLENLYAALLSRKKSLQATLSRIDVGVKNGRIPEIQQLEINSKINQIDINLNQVKTDKKEIQSSIENLTSIKLNHSIKMKQTKKIKEADFYSTKPLKYLISAQKQNLKAQKQRLYPSIFVKSNISRKFGNAYNTDNQVIRNYSNIGVFLQLPIFDKTIYSDIEKSNVDYLKSVFQLEQLKIELKAKSDALNKELTIIKSSMKTAKKEIENQKKLLKYAKVAFQTERMTEEEYLRYENSLLSAQAELFELKAKRWEIVSKLAVIYGNNLEEIIK